MRQIDLENKEKKYHIDKEGHISNTVDLFRIISYQRLIDDLLVQICDKVYSDLLKQLQDLKSNRLLYFFHVQAQH